MKNFFFKLCEKLLIFAAFFFPFLEITYYFSPRVFSTLNTENQALQLFYLNHIEKLSRFYEANVYLIFIFMVGVFTICSRGTIPLTKFVRFNVIQAILLNIVCSCLGAIYSYLPVILRESTLGTLLANFFYLGILLVIIYSVLLISYERYPTIPVLSEAAKLQVQRGYLD